MGNSINGRIRRVLTAYENHRREVAAFVFAAVMVVFGVTVILHNNGVAATHAEQVLECRQTGAVAHTHEANCFDAQGNLVCPLPELELHTHTDDCYVETYELACGLEEHVHDASCYDSEGNLVCSIPEHTHTDACYKTERVLVCGKDEITESHSHGPECFRTVEVEDTPAVQPTEDITYESQVDGVADPQTDDAADLAEDAEPEAAETMPAQRFTHSIKDAEDRLVLRVDVDAPEGALPAGATMVAQWVETTSLTAKQQEAVKTAIATRTDGAAYAQQAVDITFRDAEGNEVKPERRVAVTFTSTLLDTEDLPIIAHVDDLTLEEQQAMAEAIDGGETAEDAEPERRAEALDKLSDEALSELGISLASNQLAVACDQFSTFVLNVTTLDHSMLAEGETVRIEVVAPAAAGIPADAQLRVSEIPQGTPEYISYEADAVVAAGADEAQFSRFFDIKIVRADGTEVEPQVPVQVRIKLADAPADAPASVVHFEDDAAVGEAPELIPSEVNDLTAEFEAEGFSIYGVVYTVDLHWEVDGKTYEFSLPGGGYASFADLVEALGIADEGTEESSAAQETDGVTVSDSAKKFVANVVDVEFSNPELLSVSKAEEGTTVGAIKDELGLECEYSAELTEEQIAEINAQAVEAGDWALISLKPFDTDESLTVTMKDGAQFVIKVTDAQNITDTAAFDGTTRFVIWARGSNGNAYALMRDGRTRQIDPAQIDSLDNDYLWTIEYQGNDTGVNRYYIRSVANPQRYLTLNGTNGRTWVQGTDLIQEMSNYARTEIYHDPNQPETWHLRGWNYQNLNLGNSSNAFEGHNDYWSQIYITRQGQEVEGDYIVLSPMNENGVLTERNISSTHYKKMTIDGFTIDDNDHANLSHARIKIPVSDNGDGTATVHLPSNSVLSNFSVSDADPNRHSITQSPDKYQWKLVGWINIATDTAYDLSNVEGYYDVIVDLDDLNVFYANWVAESYDYTIPADRRIEGLDTNSFVTIKMFDYNELYNHNHATAYKVDYDAGRRQERDTLDSEEWYHNQITGPNNVHIDVVDNTDPGHAWQNGTLGNTQYRHMNPNDRTNPNYNYSLYNGTNPKEGIIGVWGTDVSNSPILSSLFDENSTYLGVNYVGLGNNLFQYDDTRGVYYYDSDINIAVYNQTNQRFYLGNAPREHTAFLNGDYNAIRKGFLPYNAYNYNATDLSFNNGTTNYWFGMNISLNFWLPDNPGSGNNANQTNGKDMVFEFRGDDDVWVLIDGKLVLDIGGIHEDLDGSINFSTGEVVVRYRDSVKTRYNIRDIVSAGDHKLEFFYMERGGNASNCEITFNITPRWVQPPLDAVSASINKTWSADTPDEAKGPLTFILKAKDKTGNDTEEYRTNPDNYPDIIDTITVDSITGDSWSHTWRFLDQNKDYIVVEEDNPDFDVTIARGNPYPDHDYGRYWAATSYDDEYGFPNFYGTGSAEALLLGNGWDDNNACILDLNGNSVPATISGDIVHDTDANTIASASWTVEYSQQDSIHFYLKKNDNQYLSIRNNRIELTNRSNASAFYMSPTGDLNDSNSDYRLLVISETGSDYGKIGTGIKRDAGSVGNESTDRVHVYTERRLTQLSYNANAVNIYKRSPIQFKKVSMDNISIDSPGIPGAKFSIYDNPPDVDGIFDENSLIANLTSGSDGLLYIDGLNPPKTLIEIHPETVYYMVETQAPEGYMPIEDVIEFILTEDTVAIDNEDVHDDTASQQNDDNDVNDPNSAEEQSEKRLVLRFREPAAMVGSGYVEIANVTISDGHTIEVPTGLIPNTSGVELPHSGGMGTTMIYFAGTVLAALAGATLLVRRRKAKA